MRRLPRSSGPQDQRKLGSTDPVAARSADQAAPEADGDEKNEVRAAYLDGQSTMGPVTWF